MREIIKKIVSVILAFVMVFPMLPVHVLADEPTPTATETPADPEKNGSAEDLLPENSNRALQQAALFGATTAFENLSEKPANHMLENETLHIYGAADVSALGSYFRAVTDAKDPYVVPGTVKWSNRMITAAVKDNAQWYLKDADGNAVERVTESGIYQLECSVSVSKKTYNFVAAEGFTIQAFQILTVRTSISDGETSETYGKVYRGNSVAVQVANQEGYAVSVFGCISADAPGEYVISDLYEDQLLQILYEKMSDSTVQLQGDHLTASFDAVMAPNSTANLVLTPDAGYYISEVTINTGSLSDVSYDAAGAYHASLTAGITGCDYVITAATAPILTISGGDIAYNPYMNEVRITESIFELVDQSSSVPGIEVSDLAVQFAYDDVWGTTWLDLDSSNVSKFGKNYEETISAVDIRVIYKGGKDNRYPATKFDDATPVTVNLVENRVDVPTYLADAVSKDDLTGIQTAAAAAAAELGLSTEDFEVPANWRTMLDAVEVGETVSIPVTAQFNGNEIYKDGTVTVNVTVTRSPLLLATITVLAEDGKGTVTITDCNGDAVNLDQVSEQANDLTITVAPHTGENFAHHVQCITVTENGNPIVNTDEGVKTATFGVKNSEAVAYTYVVSVTYGYHELTGNAEADVKFNGYSGATVESQMVGGSHFADVAQRQTLESEILEALAICYDGQPLENSGEVTIVYDPWYQDQAQQEYAHGGNWIALASEPEDREGFAGFCFGATGRPEKIAISYHGLTWTAQIRLVEGRPELVLPDGRCDDVVMIDSVEKSEDRNAIQVAALGVIAEGKPDAMPQYTFAEAEGLNKNAPIDLQVSIRYEETADYLDTTPVVVTVPIQQKDHRSTITLVENEENGTGTAKVCNADGEEVTVCEAGTLTLTVDPDDNGSYVKACTLIDRNGNQIPITGTFSNTNYSADFAIAADNAYTLTVTYAKRTLAVKGDTLDYNRFYEGKVTQRVDEVKAELIADILDAAGDTLQAKNLAVYVWHNETGSYHSIEKTSAEQPENLADSAFVGDRVKLRIVWAGDHQFPELTLTDLELTLRETRPIRSVTTKTNDNEEPILFYVDQDEENRKRLREKALDMIEPQEDLAEPTSFLYAVDEAAEFAPDFVVADDEQVHTVAVKMIWDDTETYIGTSVVVHIPVRYYREENPNKGIKLQMDSAESDLIVPGAVIYVDGNPYVLDKNCVAWIEPELIKGDVLVTAYRYSLSDTDYGRYPTNMSVWHASADTEADTLRIQRVPQLDDFFQYEGTSIRVSAASGAIRFFTSVPAETAERLLQGTLLTDSLSGYAMTKAGTVFAKYNPQNTNVTLGSGVCSDVYGSKAGKTFRVFSKTGQRNLFTGMLTGLNADAATINTGILSRPYAVLEYNGKMLTLYGGLIRRSVYYVATQNRDHFPAGSAHDDFVEKLIATGQNGS